MLFMPPIFPKTMIGPRLHFNLDAFIFDFGLGEPVGGNFLKSFYTDVPIAEEELKQPARPTVTLKASTSPFMAGVIGTLMGIFYAASN